VTILGSQEAPDGGVLLVLGHRGATEAGLVRSLSAVRASRDIDCSLDVLDFMDRAEGDGSLWADRAWGGSVVALDTARLFTEVDASVRESLKDLGGRLRRELHLAAQESGGAEWAARFAELWWLTEISTKNGPGDPYWWDLFRAGLVHHVLTSKHYDIVVVIAEAPLAGLVHQIAKSCRVDLVTRATGRGNRRLLRLLGARILGCATLLGATACARLWARLRKDGKEAARAKESEVEPAPRILAYTWYPRVWTRRFDVWQDMYYGRTPDVVRADGGSWTWAMRLYDRTSFLGLSTYLHRLRMRDRPETAPGSGRVLEQFGRFHEIVLTYLGPRDFLKFLRMTRQESYSRAFRWRGLDVRGVLERHLWRSAIVSWPHLLLLAKNAARLARRVRPDVVVTYGFEYVYGRAIMMGSRRGWPCAVVAGLQHGPFTKMKLLLAGTRSDRDPLHGGASGLPTPDTYLVDGGIAERILLEDGADASLVVACGAARLDTAWTEAPKSRSAEPGDGVFRVLVAPGLHDTPLVLHMAVRGLADESGLELIFKPHPKMSSSRFASLLHDARKGAAGQSARIRVVREGSIYEWITRSDVFLATYSSTGVEAIELGLPVVLLLPNDRPDMSLFRDSAVPVRSAGDPQALRAHVRALAADRDRRLRYLSDLLPLVKDSFGDPDGHASDRLAATLLLLANNHRHGGERAEG